MTAWLFGQTIIAGLLLGGIYALVAGGLTLIFGVVRVINFAHGDLVMVGLYATYYVSRALGVGPYLSLFVMVPVGFLVGQVLCRTLVMRIMGEDEMKPILLTAGLGMLLQNGALALWGSMPRVTPWPYATAVLQPGTMTVEIPRLVAFLLSLVVTAGFYWLLASTDLGRAIRAVSEDPEAAAAVGLNVRRTMAFTFGLGVACVGVAAPMLSPIYAVTPDFGNLMMLSAFVVVVLGGLGSFIGALLGGLLIGLSDALGAAFLPGSLAPVLGFALMIVILLFRPRGLLGV